MIFKSNCIVFSVDIQTGLDWGMVIQEGETYQKSEIISMMDNPTENLYLIPTKNISRQGITELIASISDDIKNKGVKSIPGVIGI
jgi:hypothetical protein